MILSFRNIICNNFVPKPPPRPDFGPQKADFRSESGQKSGSNQVFWGGGCSEGVGARGAGPADMALWLLGKFPL